MYDQPVFDYYASALESGDIIPSIGLLDRGCLELTDCIYIALHVPLPKSIEACLSIIRAINTSGLDSFSQTFRDGIRTDDILLLVDGLYFLNSNHVLCRETEIQEAALLYPGPMVD